MRLTAIPADSVIILNGEVLRFPFVAAPDLHAVQWYGTHGYIEYTNGNQVKTENVTDIQYFIDAFNAEKARLTAIAAAPKPPKTPAELEKEASDRAKAALAKLRSDTFADLLAFVASLTGAPQALKDAATLAAAERAKVKP